MSKRAARRWLASAVMAAAGVPLASGSAVALSPVSAGGPRVKLTAPAPAEVVVGRLAIAATVETDGVEPVLFVEFEVDGRVLFADASPPYELVWYPRVAAAHRIVARAFDAAGRVGEDQVVTAAPPRRETAAFGSRVDRVEVFVRLEGRSPPGTQLALDDFTVLEDGVPQEVLEVERSAELPVAIGFMVDSSGSMIERMQVALEGAGTFIDGLVRSEQDKAFVMSFADMPSLLQQFTNDVVRLSTSLRLISGGRTTRLYDSIISAAAEFDGQGGRRALVLLTDGHDARSDARLDDAVRAALRSDVAIYPVAVNLGSRFFHERWVLRRLADGTGGSLHDLRGLDDPRPVYESIASDLRAQYRISYRPAVSGGDGGWREIEVQLRDGVRFRGTRVRSRPGYFAE